MSTDAKGEGFTEGPWMVYITRPEDLGHTVYHVATHIETAVAVGREFWAPEDVPEQDEHGYYQPDERCALADHRLANARLIAAAPALYAVVRDAVAAGMIPALDALPNSTKTEAGRIAHAARAALTLATEGAKAEGGGK